MASIIKYRGQWLLVLASLWLLAGCSTNPVTGRSELMLISERQEISTGEQHYRANQQLGGGLYHVDPEVTRYIQEVGHRLAAVSERPHLPYEFVVLNTSVPNAWALPGGKIAINRGLLVEMDSEAELAAVLAHEVVHAAARHGAQRIQRGLFLNLGLIAVAVAIDEHDHRDLLLTGANLGAQLIFARYSRTAEREADYHGMVYMSRTGYDLQAAVHLMETFVRLSEGRARGWIEGLFASHPASQERVELNRQAAAELPSGDFLGREEYHQRLATLMSTREAYQKHDQGRRALREDDPGQALRLANEAIRLEPREALFHGLLGDAHRAAGRYAQAVAAYDAAIRRNDDYFQFWLQRGLTRESLRQLSAARDDLTHSNTLLETAVAHNGLGRIALARKERATAIGHFETAATATGPEGEAARQHLARLLIGEQPGRFVRVAAQYDSQGRLSLAVTNQAALPVGAVVVQVERRDADNQLVARQQVTVSGPIPPQNTARATTRIGSVAEAERDGVSLSVVRARVIE